MKPHIFNGIDKPHLFAHRGGNQAGAGNENSKSAFTSAVKMGYKFIETDVILTKDGEVVCYHGSLNRLSKRSTGFELRRKVRNMTYGEILKSKLLTDDVVPKLEDILATFPNTFFSIDTKTVDVVEPLVEVLKKTKAENRVIITSFGLIRTIRANKLLRGQDRQASLCLNRSTMRLIWPVWGIVLMLLRSFGVRYLQMPHRSLTKRTIRMAHAQDMYVYGWTVNKEADMRRLLSLKSDGIMSDNTELLLKTAKKA